MAAIAMSVPAAPPRSPGVARAVACALAAWVASACAQEPKPAVLHELSGPTMGSTWHLKWRGDQTPFAVRAAVEQELARIDQAFSNWRPDGELARLNANTSQAPVAVSPLLRDGLELGLRVAASSDGAFDPTVKPIVDLFRASKRSGTAAPPAELAAAVARVGWRQVQLVDDTVVRQRPDLGIDLDGLVAGLAADRLAAQLAAMGVRDFVLEITGEILCRGVRADGTPWRIGIVDPERAEPGAEAPLLSVPLADRALCTSGDYRNFAIVDGKVTTHVFDPRTGQNPPHGVVSVSVLARSCALADALGTALMVTGPELAAGVLARCPEPDAAALFVIAAVDGSLRTVEVAWPEAFALDGTPLLRPPLEDAQRQTREQDLAAARAEQERHRDQVEAVVWVGRRLGYLGRFREAEAVWTEGLQRLPDEPHLLRHRGHRRITLRDFDGAVADLERAARAVRGQPDEVEPDGQPVAGRAPHGTLQYAIHYHLGLAHFLRRDFAAAERAWRDCLAVVRNDEGRVAVTHWLWCALARQGKEADAAPLLAAIPAAPDVVENKAYLELCRLYRGDLTVKDLAVTAASWPASLAFGVAHWALVRGGVDVPGAPRTVAEARASLQAIARRADWASFGVIAAESELATR